MKLTRFIPSFLRPLLRTAYDNVARLVHQLPHRPRSRTELFKYWDKPWDGSNLPKDYLSGEERSQFLLQIIKGQAIGTGKAILEIGCNVGRNLNHLWKAGYKNLSGIEISHQAVELLREYFPDMAGDTQIYNTPVEDVIRTFDDRKFNVVFTMAVLEHIHKDSEWIFPEIARIAGELLVTIEDEMRSSWRHFRRNYREIFEPLGLTQIQSIQCGGGIGGLSEAFIARVFKKQSHLLS